MREVLARAGRLGYHAVIAGIVPPNPASVRLHTGLGFEHAGDFKEAGFKFGRWWDVSFYGLVLGPTAQDLSLPRV